MGRRLLAALTVATRHLAACAGPHLPGGNGSDRAGDGCKAVAPVRMTGRARGVEPR